MIDWKVRGYVPDSDDEEDQFVPLQRPSRGEAEDVEDQRVEAEPITSPVLSTPTQSTLQTTAERLEAVLHDGLQIVHDVRAISPPLGDLLGSAEDSPLSSPPSSLPGSPRITPSNNDLGQFEQQLPESHLNLGQHSVNHAPRRSLRARAPIQEHPYMLEDAKYRQLMKDRGLKPVQLPGRPADTSNDAETEDTQQTGATESLLPEESFDFEVPTSPSSFRSLDNMAGRQNSVAANLPLSQSDIEDGLPELSQILRKRDRSPKKVVRTKSKRSTAFHPSSQVPKAAGVLSGTFENGTESVRDAVAHEQEFRVPPSPPHSDGHFEVNDEDDEEVLVSAKVRRRTFATPIALPTPIVSSDHGGQKRTLSFETSSESSLSDTESVQLVQSDEDDSQGLRYIRQRLRGVLPPSFVKLNIDTRTRVQPRQHPVHVSVDNSNERGVARRTQVNGVNLRSPTSSNAFQVGEAESSDSDEQSNLNRKSRYDMTRSISSAVRSNNQIIAINVQEDDEIDHMSPAGLKRQRASNTNLKAQHQRRLNSTWAVSSRRTADSSATAGLSRRSVQLREKGSGTKRKKVRHKQRLPALSVLDAPGLCNTERPSQPRFLRVAARSAQKGIRQQYQDPSKKFFLLPTDVETHEVNEQLKAWKRKRGDGKPADVVADAIVFTAQQGSANGETAPLNTQLSSSMKPTRITSAKDFDTLKRSTAALLSRVSHPNQSSSNQTRGLENKVITDSTSDYNSDIQARHLRSLFAHRNRSGQGQLLTRALTTRAAQLESDHNLTETVILPARAVRKAIQKSVATPGKFDKPLTSANRNDHSPAQEPSKIHRKPRKQVPTKSSIHIAGMSDGQNSPTVEAMDASFQTSASPREVGTKVTENPRTGLFAQKAVEHVNDLKLLPAQTIFFLSSLVGSDTLRRLEMLQEEPDYDPLHPLRGGTVFISTPISTTGVSCTQYDLTVESLIKSVFSEVSCILFNSNEEPAHTDKTYMQCVASTFSVMTYFLDAAFFSASNGLTATEYLENMMTEFGPIVDGFLASSSNINQSKEPSPRSAALQCLNHLGVLTMYFRIVAQKIGLGQQSKMENLCTRILSRLLEMALKPKLLLASLRRLRDAVDDIPPVIMDQQSPFAEAESVIVVWHLYSMLYPASPHEKFYDNVKSVLFSEGGGRPIDPIDWLSLTLSALCFILPLTQFSTSGETVLHPNDIEDSDGASFNVLVKPIQTLISQYPSGRAPAVAGQLLEAVETICLKMTKMWHWNPTVSITTTLLRAYSWNSMLPFHTYPPEESIFGDLSFVSTKRWPLIRNDFFYFIELTEACIQGLCGTGTGREDQPATVHKLRGFVFSMIPNVAQLFDARNEIRSAQFLALKNHFNLYIILYTHVPEGFRPRIQQFEQQVDFSTSHYRVCQLAILAWKIIASFHVEQTDAHFENLSNVSHWMNTMICQSIKCFEVHDQFSGLALIEELLSTLATVISYCESEVKARLLLVGDTLETISKLLRSPNLHRNNEKIEIAGLKLLHAYANTTLTSSIDDTLIFEVQLTLKSMLQRTLINPTVLNTDRLQHLMSAWFVTAQIMVRTFHKHWNDFMEPSSNLSIDFLSGLRNSYAISEAKSVFYSDVIKADTSFFFLECRPIVFMTWIATLLLPVQSMHFEHILTNSILKKERDSLMIQDLAAQLFKHDSNRLLTLQDVADSRIIILRHIIQNIYGQQDYPEEEWLAGGLDSTSQKKMLNLMQKTMKAIWIDLKNDPVAQGDYTTLVHAILNEMETYPIQGVKIDSWFYEYEFPRPQQTLDNIFKCRLGESGGDITTDAIHSFCCQYTQALEAGKEDLLHEDLVRVFHCTDPLRSRRKDGSTQYSIDFAKQARFIQIIFPAFLECASEVEQSTILNPLLRLLTELTERIYFRIDNLNHDNMVNYIATTTANLCAINHFVDNNEMRHHLSPALLRYVRLCVSSVFSLLEYGIIADKSIRDMFAGNVLNLYGNLRYYVAENLTDEEKTPPLSTPPPSPDVAEEFFSRGDVVQGSWTDAPVEDFDLVPEGMKWFLSCGAAEPELTPEEIKLRAFTREELRGWEGLAGEDTLDQQWFKVELLGFIRDLKGRNLLSLGMDEDEGRAS